MTVSGRNGKGNGNGPAAVRGEALKIASTKIPNKHTIASLFAGCGGLDLGFIGGFKFAGRVYGRIPHTLLWANDIDSYACKVYRENLGRDIVEADIREVLDAGKSTARADILLGGFPCQDFSQAGKRLGFKTDRGVLYQAMVQVAQQMGPKVFVAENVKGILSIEGAIDTIKRDFMRAGFQSVQEYPVQAGDYGIPQNRQRVFIIGWKHKKHGEAFQFPKGTGQTLNTKQAIDDLKDKEWGEVDGHTWALAKHMPGLQGNETMPADGLAYTIRAEHHMNIQFHYSLSRRVSVREAARLQSFPDEFRLGGVSKNQGYRMIGNAVPPVLAWHLAKAIHKALTA